MTEALKVETSGSLPMGYTGPYSLGARCGTEAMATGLMIFLGEGCLANELLSKTKGQGMGFGWTAFGFGFAFFVSLAIWNGVSAYMSPSFVMGLWVIGEVSTGRSPSGECLSCHVSTSLKMFPLHRHLMISETKDILPFKDCLPSVPAFMPGLGSTPPCDAAQHHTPAHSHARSCQCML